MSVNLGYFRLKHRLHNLPGDSNKSSSAIVKNLIDIHVFWQRRARIFFSTKRSVVSVSLGHRNLGIVNGN